MSNFSAVIEHSNPLTIFLLYLLMPFHMLRLKYYSEFSTPSKLFNRLVHSLYRIPAMVLIPLLLPELAPILTCYKSFTIWKIFQRLDSSPITTPFKKRFQISFLSSSVYRQLFVAARNHNMHTLSQSKLKFYNPIRDKVFRRPSGRKYLVTCNNAQNFHKTLRLIMRR